jgi:hydrogenase maturation protein HypF
VTRLAVQHHHAHLASCLAENGLREPAIGVVFDGTGLGTDGAIWGGEFLVGEYTGFHRAAHLRYVALPGGEQAIREPWRIAVAHLIDAGVGLELVRDRVSATALATVERMITGKMYAPLTSSMGRLFDAVAVLAGLRQRVSYDGQAAVELEAHAAHEAGSDGSYPFTVVTADDCEGASGQREPSYPRPPLVIDTRPLIASVASDVRNGYSVERIGRRFHTTIVEIIDQVCCRLRDATGLDAVALSGGVFMNALLHEESTARLSRAGFRVYRHEHVPPNDGGLSFGQLAVAAAWDQAIVG